MKKWEYMKLTLNETSRRGDEIDLLCQAGEEGWELIAVLPTGTAYLKRELEEGDAANEEAPDKEEPTSRNRPIIVAAPEVENVVGPEVKAKYRDPVTGDTWTGRGRMASWLKRKQDAGADIKKYRV